MNVLLNRTILTINRVREILNDRKIDSHKGTYGHALIFAGSKGRMGASVISSKDSILIPHPKEFDRIFGEHLSKEERMSKSIEKAKELKCVIVLKGNQTFITNGEESFLNSTGNSGLSKGGSGDALTGLITSFLAQKYSAINAAKLGVFIHGLAADLSLKSQSEESMLVSDVIENLGFAFKEIRK